MFVFSKVAGGASTGVGGVSRVRARRDERGCVTSEKASRTTPADWR